MLHAAAFDRIADALARAEQSDTQTCASKLTAFPKKGTVLKGCQIVYVEHKKARRPPPRCDELLYSLLFFLVQRQHHHRSTERAATTVKIDSVHSGIPAKCMLTLQGGYAVVVAKT
jgi:hypothetical protein